MAANRPLAPSSTSAANSMNTTQQISQDVFLAAPPSQYSLSPVEGAGKVVDVLKKTGTLDTLRGKALDATKQNESLRSQVEQMLRQAELLQPGKTYSKAEADRLVANFYSKNEKQLVGLLRDTLYTVVTDELDPSGLAARHRLLVMQTLLAELEREEMQRQQEFKQRQQQHYVQLQAEWLGHYQQPQQQRPQQQEQQQQQRQAEQEQQQQLQQQQQYHQQQQLQQQQQQHFQQQHAQQHRL